MLKTTELKMSMCMRLLGYRIKNGSFRKILKEPLTDFMGVLALFAV